jgi:hypothetical protein
MISAGNQLVRVVIDTTTDSANKWAKARSIDPETMDWGTHVRTDHLANGRARVTLAVSQDDYDAAVDNGWGDTVSAYFEELLNGDAMAITYNHNASLVADTIPMVSPSDAYETTCFVVRWSIHTAADIFTITSEATNRIKEVRITRLTPVENDFAWFLVLVPDFLYSYTVEDHLNLEGFVFKDIVKCLEKNIRDGVKPISAELEAKLKKPAPALNAKESTTDIDDEIPF